VQERDGSSSHELDPYLYPASYGVELGTPCRNGQMEHLHSGVDGEDSGTGLLGGSRSRCKWRQAYLSSCRIWQLIIGLIARDDAHMKQVVGRCG